MRATETKDAAEKDREAFMDRARKCVDPCQLRGSSAGHYFVLVEQRAWGPYKSPEDAALDAERYLRGEPAIIVDTAKAG